MYTLGSSTELLDALVAFKPEYDTIPIEGPDDSLHINNQWFTTVDMEVLYAMVRYLKPKQMIEIGSGHSTRCTLQAIAANGSESPCVFTAIDPDPRLAVDDLAGVTVLRQPVESVPLAVFQALNPGDVLFIDSSHIWAKGNDVDFEYHQLLPSLKSGVIVHVHDIFLPEGYPSHWSNRGYTEQRYVALLLMSGMWDIIWSAHYMHEIHPTELTAAFRSYTPTTGYPASLWMIKR